MADSVNTEVLFSGTRKYVVRFTNKSDGTGETAVTKIDRSALVGATGKAPAKLVLQKIQYSIQGFEAVQIDWDAGTDELCDLISGDNYFDYTDNGRWPGKVPDTSASADVTATTGDILFTTIGTPTANDTYSITLEFKLKG